ncbi:MAG: DUF808 family protein [Alphaproteobacteria bacterium]|nr:DUF808 family protein [Alphaproteobacteria bacterium]
MTKISTQKAAAILADDIAVNTSILQETEPKRRLPAVLKVMGGSLAIKAAMIPVALLVSSFAPWAILPMLAVAGLHLATEGAEKMKGEKAPSCENHNQHDANSPACPIRPKTARELEKEKIKEALVIDGVLTAEITVLTLAITAGAPILTVLGVLAATGLIRTGWMYGVVAGLTNMDTGGKWLAEREGDGLLAKTARGIGRGLSKSAPYLMKGISLVGTLALFVIGGELMLHGIPGAEHMVTGSLTALSTNPIVQYAISHIAEAAVGLAAGFAAAPIMEKYVEPAIGKSVEAIKKMFGKIFPRRAPETDAPQPSASLDNTVVSGKLQTMASISAAMNEVAQRSDSLPSNQNRIAPAGYVSPHVKLA